MSRSQKRLANKSVRRDNKKHIDDMIVLFDPVSDYDIADGNSYRRIFNSWDICDYKFPSTDAKASRK